MYKETWKQEISDLLQRIVPNLLDDQAWATMEIIQTITVRHIEKSGISEVDIIKVLSLLSASPHPKLKPYPEQVCDECATKAGGSIPKGHLATWHNAICDVCGKEKAVTEPRDYRYPKFEGHTKA